MEQDELKKLPKFAQDYINRLERELKEVKSDLKDLQTESIEYSYLEDCPSKVTRSKGLTKNALPEDQTYSFQLTDRRNDIVKVTLKEGKLELYNSTDVNMVIEPTATNIFNIRFLDFDNRFGQGVM